MFLINWYKLFFAILLAISGQALASSSVEDKSVSIPAGIVHIGDYFVWSDSVEISGIIEGDLYVLAGQVIIDGEVHGDVIAMAGSIDVSGSVTGNIRVLAGQVLISGIVGRNVSLAAGNAQFLPSSSIGHNVALLAGNADVGAVVGDDVSVVASNLRLSSIIGRKVRAYVGQLRITSKARIGGNVDYQSSDSAWIDSGAVIGGTVTHQPSLVHELFRDTWAHGLIVGGRVLALLMNFIYSFVIGLVLIKMFPRNLENALEVLHTHPWKALSWGLLLMVLVPLVSLVLFMTILGAPFALTLIAANIIGFYTAKIYSIFWVSQWICKKMRFHIRPWVMLCLGLIVYFMSSSIPVLGTIVALAAMWWGLGAGVLAQAKRPAPYRGARG